MSEKRREIRQAKRTPGESPANARERARQAAEQSKRRRRQRNVVVGAVVGLLVLALVAGVGYQWWRTHQNPTAETGPDTGFVSVKIEPNKPVEMGKKDAKVTLTVYSDFLCPHCQDFEQEFSPTIKSLQDAGTLRVEAVPITVIDAQLSPTLTNAYACAVDEGAGPAYYSALFANSSLQWSNEQLVALGKQVKPDMPESFNTCVTRRQHQDWTDQMNAYAGQHDVKGTPTLFLDGQPLALEGLTPDKLRQAVEEAAKK